MDNLVQPMLDFIKVHEAWAVVLLFTASFGESFVLVGLVLPGTALLIATGTLIKTGSLHWLPVVASAVLGAVLGDGLSYWIGCYFGRRIGRVWPFSRNRELLPKGVRFFKRYGGMSVFIGRFFGPIRAVIPLAAGIMEMPPLWFWIANVTSALVWGPALLFFGDAIGKLGESLVGSANTVVLVFAGLTVVGLAGALWAGWHSVRSKT